MKKLITVLLMAIFIINTPAYTLDIDIDENIDPLSLDMLIRQGVISEKDRDKYLKVNISLSVEDETEDGVVKTEQDVAEKEEYIAAFAVESIKQIGENSIMVTFNQKLGESAYIKNNYTIKDDSGKTVFKYSDFEVRKVINDNKSIALKLKTKKFIKDMEYKLTTRASLRSFYMISVDSGTNENSKFIISSEMSNDEVISYNAYSDGYIDVKFKYEVSDKLLSSKKYYNVSYSDGKLMHFAKSVETLEDDDGVIRTMRIMFSKFYDKYDYKLSLDVKNLDLTNNVYNFPGGSTLSNYFNVEDINIIDTYTIDIILNTKLNYTGDKELVRINSNVVLDNFEVYGGDHIILHLKKDAGLDYLSQYSIELVNFTSIDNRKLANVSYTFATEEEKIQTEYVDIELVEARWTGDGYIKVLFSKPVDLLKSVKSFMKVKDENGKSVKIEDGFELTPTTFVIKSSSGGYGDAYTVYIDDLPEKGNQFRSEEDSITINN